MITIKVCGPPNSGKSTLIETIARDLEHCHLEVEQRYIGRPPPKNPSRTKRMRALGLKKVKVIIEEVQTSPEPRT